MKKIKQTSRNLGSNNVIETIICKWNIIRTFPHTVWGTLNNLPIECRKAESYSVVIIYNLRVTSYFLRVEKENYQLLIYFTSCESLFTRYKFILRVPNLFYDLKVTTYDFQIAALFHLKKTFYDTNLSWIHETLRTVMSHTDCHF